MVTEFDDTQVFESEFASGQIFDEYQIERLLGEGAMGSVYKAKSTQSNVDVALKILIAQNRSMQENIHRFINEAQTISLLNHPNIVKLYKSGVANKKYFIAMQYIDGKDLKVYAKEKKISKRKAVELTIKILQAIDYAHNQKIIHRDLKPANIMIAADGQPYIMDFGLAKATNDSNKLTQTGNIMGTPAYMAPEQIEGKRRQIDKSCDIYAIGVILYEFLTGKVPFFAPTQWELFNKIASKEPATPSKVNPQISKVLDKICLKALAKNKNERYKSAKEFSEELEKVFISKKKKKQSKKNQKVFVGALVCIFAAISLFFLFSKKAPKHVEKKTSKLKKKSQIASIKKVPLQKKVAKKTFLSTFRSRWKDVAIKDSRYFGEMKNFAGKALAHGNGRIITQRLKSKYAGQFFKGNKHGYGVYYKVSNTSTYVYMGRWQKNKRDGYSTEIGTHFKFAGNYKNGKRMGDGVYFWADSKIYAGEFADKKHGEGVILDAKWKIFKMGRWQNDVYIGKSSINTRWKRRVISSQKVSRHFSKFQECVYYGEVQNSVPSGKGLCRVVFGTKNAFFYFGNWHNGFPQGKGIIVYIFQNKKNSGFYIGEVKGFRKQGIGLQTFPNLDSKLVYAHFHKDRKFGRVIIFSVKGDIIDVEHKNGIMDGKGVYVRWDKAIYVGQWQKGVIQGTGTYSLVNGGIYTGEWVKNKKHGKGTFAYPDGRKYIGMWKNDLQHGIGKLFLANGQLETEGLWVNGKLKK